MSKGASICGARLLTKDCSAFVARHGANRPSKTGASTSTSTTFFRASFFRALSVVLLWAVAPGFADRLRAEGPSGPGPGQPPNAPGGHWAFQPISDPSPPDVHDRGWARTAIDRFILAKMESHGLRPARPAEKRILLRRVTFDLTGLPPAPEALDAFEAEASPEGLARAVDRLLASPRYGECWGRHWLDVARYADSNGMDENLAYADAWRYRDYVIRSFNADKPFPRFLQEQLAGDLLTGGNDPDPVVATGFLCLGPKMLAEDDPTKMEMDIIDEQLDTTSRVFMGLTVGCSRCHDHKYDPIPMSDYYAMAGIFKSTRTMENFKVVARWQERPLGSPSAIAALTAHRRKVLEATNAVALLIQSANSNLIHEAASRTGDYLLAAQDQLEHERRRQATPSASGARPDSSRPGLLIEAEAFQRGENITATHHGYGEGIGIIYGDGGKTNAAEYDISLPAAAWYRIEVRYAAAAARPVRLLLNRHLARSELAGRVTGSWNPDTQTWELAGVFELPAGASVLRLERDDCIPHLDKIYLEALSADEAARAPSDEAWPGESRQLVPQFVRQWIDWLQKSETNSVLAEWHARVAGNNLSGARASLGPDGPPATTRTRASLAASYTALFQQADRAGNGEPPEAASATAVESVEHPGPALAEAARRALRDPKGPFAITKAIEESYPAEVGKRLRTARTQLKALEDSLPALPEAMAVADGTPEDLRVHKRGSHLHLGEPAARGFLHSIGAPAGLPLPTNGSGRLELAQWLARPEHPLTARVIVNRVWQWHFGEGLVRSPDNFGKLGEQPTHPELLDWLARRLVASGWSIKALHRLILDSAVYQQAVGDGRDSAAQIDPDNRFWSHFNRRRLEAEAVRDSILALGGQLDLSTDGSLLSTRNHEYVTGTASKMEVSIYNSNRRSVYLPVIRSALYDLFQVFDFADPSVSNGHRDQTTVAPQALFMLNSRLVARAARRLAEALISGDGDDHARVSRLYRLAYGRQPIDAEATSALGHLESYRARRDAAGVKPDESRVAAWQSLCRAVFSANEFIYLD